MNKLSWIAEISVWILPVLFAITAHEAAHGWVAHQLGDNTAKRLSRLTLNPLKHMDMLGTVIVPCLSFAMGGFVFGWAKPVPVNALNFKNPKRDLAWVAIAGPFSNLGMALGWAAIAKLGDLLFLQGVSTALFLVHAGIAGIHINLMLMLVNLIPIPPLDGSRVLALFLPSRLQKAYAEIEPYGFGILAVFMYFNLLTKLIGPAFTSARQLIINIFSL